MKVDSDQLVNIKHVFEYCDKSINEIIDLYGIDNLKISSYYEDYNYNKNLKTFLFEIFLKNNKKIKYKLRILKNGDVDCEFFTERIEIKNK